MSALLWEVVKGRKGVGEGGRDFFGVGEIVGQRLDEVGVLGGGVSDGGF